jgi:hypothetical protein
MINSMLMLLTLNYWAFSSLGGCAPTPTPHLPSPPLPSKERAKIELGGEQGHKVNIVLEAFPIFHLNKLTSAQYYEIGW